MAVFEPDEMEMLLEFPTKHMRGGGLADLIDTMPWATPFRAEVAPYNLGIP